MGMMRNAKTQGRSPVALGFVPEGFNIPGKLVSPVVCAVKSVWRLCGGWADTTYI
jgi:hypothetical protein